jgi:signal transduction histidine kinase
VTTRAGSGPRRARWLTALDVVAGAACTAVVLGTFFTENNPYALPTQWVHPRIWLPVLLAICLSAPVAVRRKAPLTALAIVLAATLITLILGGAITIGPVLPMALVLYVIAAARRIVAVTGLVAALTLLAVQGYLFHRAGVGSGDATGVALFLIICWGVGFGVQQRRAYVVRLREQAASVAVTEERLRIARELHDVVAHSMTVVAVQAGFGEYVFDSQPGQARAALAAIQTVTRDALTDMQRLLGVLRQAEPAAAAAAPGAGAGAAGQAAAGQPAAENPDGHGERPAPGPAPLAPAPGLADLDRLASATAGAGVQVEIRRTGAARPIPAGTDLSAFRIVQEALTNVVKHSGAARCLVGVDYGASKLSVSITDPGPCPDRVPPPGARPAAFPHGGTAAFPPGQLATADGPPRAGHGMVGMAERVSLCGGQFSAGPLPAGGFGVRAHLPIPAAPPGEAPALAAAAGPVLAARAEPQ